MMGQISEEQQKMQELTNTAIDELTHKNEKLIDQQIHLLEVSDAHRLVNLTQCTFSLNENPFSSITEQRWKVIYTISSMKKV